MSVFYGTMTSKGQTTVPAEVRDILHLKPGDKIRYVHRNGEIIMKAKNKRLSDLVGRFHDPARSSISVQDMQDAIADAATDRLMDSR